MNLRLLLVSVFCLSSQCSALASDTAFSGTASWYGKPFHGRKTASGEIFDMNKHSAAHKTLKLITKVMVENPKTGKSAVVRVNDRGPYVKTRVMDLSRKAADDLGYLSHGTAYLDFTVLGAGAAGASASSSKVDKAEPATKTDANSSSKPNGAEESGSDASSLKSSSKHESKTETKSSKKSKAESKNRVKTEKHSVGKHKAENKSENANESSVKSDSAQ